MDETLEQVNEQVESINEQVEEVERNQGDELDLPTLSPIQSEDLQQEEDAELPEPPTDTATTGLQGIIESLTAQRKEARESLTESREDIQSTMQEILDVQGQRDELREQRGIPETQTELDELDAQLEQKQLALRRQKEKIQSQAGLTTQQANARIQEVERKATSEMADIAVVRSAKAQQLQTARNIVDNKIEAQLEPLRQQFKFQQSFFERNQNIFDKSEKREFQALLQQEQRNFEQTREQTTELENTKFSLVQQAVANNAPASVLSSIQKAESRQEAVQAAGQFGFQQEQADTQIITAGGQKQLINTQTGEVIRNLGAADVEAGGGEAQSEFEQARNIIRNNPNMSRLELFNRIRDEAGLGVSDTERVLAEGVETTVPAQAQEIDTNAIQMQAAEQNLGITQEDVDAFNANLRAGFTPEQIFNSANLNDAQRVWFEQVSGFAPSETKRVQFKEEEESSNPFR